MDTPCWEYQGPSFHEFGYGRFGGEYAHRLSYRAWYGSIPDGLLVMHLCDNPPCVNPLHLRAGTQAENMATSPTLARNMAIGRQKAWKSLAARNSSGKMARKTCRLYGRCGHPLFGPNLYLKPNGKRSCRTCRTDQARRRRKA